MRAVFTAFSTLVGAHLSIKQTLEEALKALLISQIADRHGSNVVSFYQSPHSYAMLPCISLWKRRRGVVLTIFGELYDDPSLLKNSKKFMDRLISLPNSVASSLENSYLQVDETPTLCLESKKKCYMWVYSAFKDRRPNIVIFDFQMTRGQIAVNTRLHAFKGVVQTDGYGGYNTLRKRPDIIGIGCGAHIRRKFDAVNHLAQKVTNYNHLIHNLFIWLSTYVNLLLKNIFTII